MPQFRIGVRAGRHRKPRRDLLFDEVAPLPNSCLFPGDAFFFSPRRGLLTSPLPEFAFITRFSYTRFQMFRTPFHNFSPSTATSSLSSHMSALLIDDVSNWIHKLPHHVSPFAMESDDLSDMWERDEDAEEAERNVTAQSGDWSRSATIAAATSESPADSESPISCPKYRQPDSAGRASEQSVSRSSVKRSAESCLSDENDDDDDDNNEDPVRETQMKKPVLRFRKLKVARKIFEQTQGPDSQLEQMFGRLDIAATPGGGDDDDDEEPISIKSGSECSGSFFLSKSSVRVGTPVGEAPVASSPKSWNSHSCEQSHGQSVSGLRQTQ